MTTGYPNPSGGTGPAAGAPAAPTPPQPVPTPPQPGPVPPSASPPSAGHPSPPAFHPSMVPPPHATPPSVSMSAAGPQSGAGAAVPPPVRSRSRPVWPGIAAFVLVIVLALVAGFEAYQINRLSDRIRAMDEKLAEAQAGDDARLDALEGRADELAELAGKVFDPQEIAGAVLPSVFRVRAGEVTGTAFAIGEPADGGGTNLLTNLHVVEEVWRSGQRKVFLERASQRFPATIVDVDQDNDLALLTTNAKFTGLTPASSEVEAGQQIIVVGAPLGLEDSVTTGVVSAFRDLEDGSGKVIQFDAPINPGNSGGPVVNGAKQVVGIATAKARDAEGIGMAVPIGTACEKFKVC